MPWNVSLFLWIKKLRPKAVQLLVQGQGGLSEHKPRLCLYSVCGFGQVTGPFQPQSSLKWE